MIQINQGGDNQAFGYYYQNETNIINSMMNAGIRMMKGGNLEQEINELTKTYGMLFNFKSGGKRIVAIPLDPNKHFVIKVSRFRGKHGCVDNYNEYVAGVDINNRYPNEAYVPMGIALLGVQGADNLIHIQEKFFDIIDTLVGNGTNKEELARIFLHDYMVPNRTRIDTIKHEVMADYLITDESETVSYKNYGFNRYGKIGMLDIGSIIHIGPQAALKCGACGCELKYTSVDVNIVKSAALNGIHILNNSSDIDKYVCSNHACGTTYKTEDMYAAVYNAVHNGVPTNFLVNRNQLNQATAANQPSNINIDLTSLGYPGTYGLSDNKQYRLGAEIVSGITYNSQIIGYVSINAIQQSGANYKKIFNTNGQHVGWINA